MSVRDYLEHSPALAEGVYVDPAGVVIGKVTIGRDSSVWPGAVVRGDVNFIEVGERTSVQDGAVLHVTHDSHYHPGGYPLHIGNDVTIGHNASLHGCTIGNRVLIGIGAIVLDGALVPDDTIIGAGALVPPGKQLARGHLYVGSPVRQARALSEQELEGLAYNAAHYVRLKNQFITRQN